jgi:hypothetical protein
MSTDDQQPHPWMLEDVQLRAGLAADAMQAASQLSIEIASLRTDPSDKKLFEGIARDTAHVAGVARSYALHLRETNVAMLLRRDIENKRPMSQPLLEEMRSLLAADVANQNGAERVTAMQKEFEADAASFISKRLVPTTQRSGGKTHNITTR